MIKMGKHRKSGLVIAGMIFLWGLLITNYSFAQVDNSGERIKKLMAHFVQRNDRNKEIEMILADYGTKVLPYLINGLDDRNEAMQYHCLGAILEGVGGVQRAMKNKIGKQQDLTTSPLFSEEERRIFEETYQATLRMANHKDVEIRRRAINTLKLFGSPKSIPIFEKALSDKDISVRLLAVGGLKSVGRFYSVFMVVTGEEPETPEQLAKLLGNDWEEVRIAAENELRRLGSKSIPALLGAAAKDVVTTNQRERAIRLLVEMKEDRVVPILIQCLEKPVEGVSPEWALKDLNTPTSIAALVRYGLHNRNPYIQLNAAKLLIEKETGLVISVLETFEFSKEAHLKFRAAELLVRHKVKSGIPILIELLKDKDRNSSYDANKLLKEVTGQSFGSTPAIFSTTKSVLYDRWQSWWEKNKDTFEFAESNSAPSLKISEEKKTPEIPRELQPYVERLSSNNPSERLVAAYELGNMREKAAPAIPQLIEKLNDNTRVDTTNQETSPFVNIAAGRALEKIGQQTVVPLIAELQNNSIRRIHIMSILAHIGDPRAIEPLLRYVSYNNEGVRHHAVEALKKLTGQNFGDRVEDTGKWKAWWEKNEGNYQK